MTLAVFVAGTPRLTFPANGLRRRRILLFDGVLPMRWFRNMDMFLVVCAGALVDTAASVTLSCHRPQVVTTCPGASWTLSRRRGPMMLHILNPPCIVVPDTRCSRRPGAFAMEGGAAAFLRHRRVRSFPSTATAMAVAPCGHQGPAVIVGAVFATLPPSATTLALGGDLIQLSFQGVGWRPC